MAGVHLFATKGLDDYGSTSAKIYDTDLQTLPENETYT